MTDPASIIQIRPYTPSDKDAVIALLRMNTPAYFAVEEEKDLLFYLEHEREDYFVVESDGVIAGSGGINFENNKTLGKISWDMVHPAYHGKGLGRALVKHRLHILKSMTDVKTIRVRTTQLVYPFYQKQGFVLKETRKDFWAPGFDLYSMDYEG